MAIYLGHTTALELWSYADAWQLAQRPRARVSNLDDAEAQAGAVAGAAQTVWEMGLLKAPYHVLVGSDGKRLMSNKVQSHTCGSALPRRAFVRLEKGTYVSSPEFCFLQMAGSMTEAQLAMLGYELCGSYACDQSERGFYERPAVTTAEQIRRFLDGAQGFKHVNKARRVARYIANGAASPREAMTAILLCFPGNLGGYAFELPVMNKEVLVDDGRITYGRKRRFVCDLCWPKAHVAIEYDSSAHHEGLGDIDRDSKRRAALEQAGMKVITVTKAQLANCEEMHKVAEVLAQYMGRVLRPRARGFYDKRIKLRHELLGPRSS